jgi:hypothetical protein
MCNILFKLLSSFAFKFNLRRYTKAFHNVGVNLPSRIQRELAALEAGAYTRPLFGST